MFSDQQPRQSLGSHRATAGEETAELPCDSANPRWMLQPSDVAAEEVAAPLHHVGKEAQWHRTMAPGAAQRASAPQVSETS